MGRGTITLKPLGGSAAAFGYIEYLPAGYVATNVYPLIIFLHGAGEVGDGSATANGLNKVFAQGPPRLLQQNLLDLPAIVISPQTDQGSWGEDAGNSTKLNAFLDFLIAHYAVDTHRVYMTGLSLGGGGTWAYAARYPKRLAAIVPICGFGSIDNAQQAEAMVDAGLPVWAAHAMDDPQVDPGYTLNNLGLLANVYGLEQVKLGRPAGSPSPYFESVTQTFVMDPSLNPPDWRTVPGQVYEDANGQFVPRQFGTFYPSGGHGIWDRMYTDPQIYTWLLQFSN